MKASTRFSSVLSTLGYRFELCQEVSDNDVARDDDQSPIHADFLGDKDRETPPKHVYSMDFSCHRRRRHRFCGPHRAIAAGLGFLPLQILPSPLQLWRGN